MAARGDTPLSAIPSIPATLATKLQASWITTAEQLLAVAATSGGTEALINQLKISREELNDLLNRARRALPSGVVKEVETRADTSQQNLGALPPKDKN